MATKRGEKSSLLELRERGSGGPEVKPSFRPFRRPNDFVERTVLPTDTLQGIALLYNTTVAEIKKLNQLQTDGELHARRVIKVPSRGILINLEPPPSTPRTADSSLPSTTFSMDNDDDPDSTQTEGAGLAYLNNKDSLLTEIRAKVSQVAATSPILNEGEGHEFSHIRVHGATLDRRTDSPLKWWHVLFPCLGFVILFPILLFLFQEHLHDLGHKHDGHASSASAKYLPSTSEYILPDDEN